MYENEMYYKSIHNIKQTIDINNINNNKISVNYKLKLTLFINVIVWTNGRFNIVEYKIYVPNQWCIQNTIKIYCVFVL